jgi:hypothetical protein
MSDRGEAALVFGRSATEAVVRSTLRTHSLKAWEAAGLEPLTPHEARHCAVVLRRGRPDAEGGADRYGPRRHQDDAQRLREGRAKLESGAAAKLDAFLEGAATSS